MQDDYLNGLVATMYYERDPVNGFFCESDYIPSLAPYTNCEFADSNPFILGYHPIPTSYEIIKLWTYLKQRCYVEDEEFNILPNNTCITDAVARADEQLGAEKCKTYYFWNAIVKSRPCMIKNAKLEELENYAICGTDRAFLCTKESAINAKEYAEKKAIEGKRLEESIKARKLARERYDPS